MSKFYLRLENDILFLIYCPELQWMLLLWKKCVCKKVCCKSVFLSI